MKASPELLAAVETGDGKTLTRLLESQPDLGEARTSAGISIILHALYHRQAEFAHMLARSVASLDVHEAAALDAVDELEAGLARDPPAARGFSADGFTPLHYAGFFAARGALETLLVRGADVRVRSDNSSRVTPLHSAAAAGDAAIVQRLLQAGAEADARQAGGYTALMSAAHAGNGPMVDVLMAAGASASLRDDAGRSAADLAEEAGYGELAGRLRGAG
ncbi:MAG: ankyrin repeat domain-containing protein [Gammaproteobacteria bacterium]